MESTRAGSLARRAPWIAAALAVLWFAHNLSRYFPNHLGRLGYDYGLFLPWMTGGYFWERVNGPLVPPEYLPSFCGGVPFLFNPQSVYWSLPQALMTVMPPLQSLLASWVLFGLAGLGGMYALLRRVFGTSAPAALLGGVIFLLNGFYTTRMIIGHFTFHGVMLTPLIAALLFARPNAHKRLVRLTLRCCAAALLLAYLFYSGGTNTILPMMLALLILALLLAWTGGWHRVIPGLAAVTALLWMAMCAYKLVPALAFAGNVVRPISLRMTGDLVTLLGGAGISLFTPQVLAFLPADKLVLDRVEFEYGVGLVPLLAILAGLWTAYRRKHLALPFTKGRWPLVAAMALLLVVPVLLNWDALGMRALVLHLPVVKMMSVMLRFWFVYVPLLCVLTALLLDYLCADAGRRAWLATAAIALTLAQAASTDMRWYADQTYDPAPLLAAHARVAAGGAVPAITRIADPWEADPALQTAGSGRNDAVVKGISDVPCYEPMFGYRMEVFRQGRLASGPVLQERNGLLNLKNPACYTFAEANMCRPGDEFTAAQRPQAEAFAQYKPFAHAWPTRQYVAAGVSLTVFLLVVGMALSAALLLLSRRRTA